MNPFISALNADLVSGGATRFNNAQYSGVRCNGLMANIVLTPKATKSWSLDILKAMYLNVNFRQANADDIQLHDSVRLWDFCTYSDLNGGVSLVSVDAKTKTNPVEFSAYLDHGFIQVNGEESLEVLLTGTPSADFDVKVILNWVFHEEKESALYCYKSYSTNGGEQTDRDVRTLCYIGASADINATLRDLSGSNTVSLRDSVALANAIGRMETFTEIGLLYQEPFGISQDLTVRLDSGKNLFAMTESFNSLKANDRDSDTKQRFESVLQQVYTSKPDKYRQLKDRGLIPAGFVPR